ncbi:hypothetical protein JQ594_05315 [Bradyrhizobium manausense]|uniref:hypothetical protein n=1 Tax=Bradyrhizobium manausense TaxID=989370 RepID=UPI001BAB18B6|nr:hypothetical protein [Bradyrhizobium manausense]MBR0685324.1 hypothetical protein [Bradyrhizobium manausense]
MGRYATIALGLFLGGCASTQLNYNTIDIANNSDNLLTKQVLYNLSAYLDNPIAVPAQIVVTGGTASTSNSVTPSAGAPLDRALSVTSATNISRTSSIASPTIGISANDGWTQSYTFAPITDPDRTKRLDTLYRYAIDWSADPNGNRKFVSNFPLIYKSVNYAEPLCLVGKKADNAPNETVDVTADGKKLCATSVNGNAAARGQATRSYSRQVADEHFLSGPTCVVCGAGRHLHPNAKFSGPWLHWQNASGAPVPLGREVHPGDIPLGSSGGHAFFISPENAQKFVDFSIAVQSASILAAGGAAGSASASAAGGGSKSITLFDTTTGQPLIGLSPQ